MTCKYICDDANPQFQPPLPRKIMPYTVLCHRLVSNPKISVADAVIGLTIKWFCEDEA